MYIIYIYTSTYTCISAFFCVHILVAPSSAVFHLRFFSHGAIVCTISMGRWVVVQSLGGTNFRPSRSVDASLGLEMVNFPWIYGHEMGVSYFQTHFLKRFFDRCALVGDCGMPRVKLFFLEPRRCDPFDLKHDRPCSNHPHPIFSGSSINIRGGLVLGCRILGKNAPFSSIFTFWGSLDMNICLGVSGGAASTTTTCLEAPIPGCGRGRRTSESSGGAKKPEPFGSAWTS